MYGLVLEGGGARGAYHIGAYKAIMEKGIEINGIAGTSAGALNGALIIQDDYEKAYELWNNMSYTKIINDNNEEVKNLKEKIKGVFSERGLDITPLKNLIRGLLNEDKIRSSGKDFGIVTICLTDLKPLEIYIEDIPPGKLGNYLMASAYLPAFRPERIDGKIYIDGGIYNNLPVNLLRNKGYKDLILVRTCAPGIIRKADLDGLNIITISPKYELGKVLDFDRETARYNIRLGYLDGLKVLQGLKGHNYYIKSNKDEEYFISHLLNLDEDKLLELRKIFKIEGIHNRRTLFETIMPKLARILGVEKEENYEDIFYTLLEVLAEFYEIEKLNIYTYNELLNLVKEKSKEQDSRDMGIIDKMIKKTELLSFLGREEIIKKIGTIIL